MRARKVKRLIITVESGFQWIYRGESSFPQYIIATECSQEPHPYKQSNTGRELRLESGRILRSSSLSMEG
jgi:hypothetical protein